MVVLRHSRPRRSRQVLSSWDSIEPRCPVSESLFSLAPLALAAGTLATRRGDAVYRKTSSFVQSSISPPLR